MAISEYKNDLAWLQILEWGSNSTIFYSPIYTSILHAKVYKSGKYSPPMQLTTDYGATDNWYFVKKIIGDPRNFGGSDATNKPQDCNSRFDVFFQKQT